MHAENPFVHLHVHSEFSLLDGLSRIPRLVERAKELEMPALAITDHGTMFGVIDFYNACKKAGIKPIIGMESYLAKRGMTDRDPKEDRKPYHMLLLAKDNEGYKNLLKLASKAQLEGYYYNPRIDRDLLAAHSKGLIATSGCLAAEIPNLVMNGQEDRAREQIGWYQDVFGPENFYLELQQHDIRELVTVNKWLNDYRKSGHSPVQLVATNDVHYVRKSDHDPHDTLLCIQTSTLKSDPDRMRMSDASYYLTDQAEMWQYFGEMPEALHNTLKIAEMCEIDLDRKGYHLPNFPVPDDHTSETYLRYLCEKGMGWRYGDRRHDPVLRQRMDYELDIIHNMGFETYFLIVWDLCEFARYQDIWWNVRGSGAGSIVAYSLGITSIDPIQNKLLFERFLNPGRVSMPDIDLDYPEDRRAEMIAYTARKYGEEKVAAIITFGTLGAKAAVRDVGRALGMPLELVNQAARLIPTEPKPKPVLEYVEANPDLKKMYDSDPDIKLVMDTAAELQGVSRHASTHAAGIIVGDKPLVEYIPLHRQTKGERDTDNAIKQVTQFPMETCEAIGLLKIDFLGLSTLTILRRACDLIARHRGLQYTMDNIPYRPNGDPQQDRMLVETFEMVGRGETIGVFQVESSGMQQMLRGMRPTTFEHIVAGIALYRPGPMDFIPTYNNRMHGSEAITYHHPLMEPILEETFGILVYQEQIMQVASDLFGYQLGEADLMRKAVSKKMKEDLQKHRDIFLTRGPEHGVDVDTAAKIFDEIEFFANYGFNRAHAADYGVITVQTAFLKAHYPEEYITALLSVYSDDSLKVTTFLTESKRLNIPILPPDVNYSELDFSIQQQKDGKRGIRFGLKAIKNAGVGALQHMIEAREAGGPFRDLEEFCTRIDLRAVGKRTVESLIKVGAMSTMGTRPQLLSALERMVSYSAEHHKNKDIGQISMFGGPAGMVGGDLLKNLPVFEEASARDMLNWEKELLGLYVSSHPIDPILNLLPHIQPNYTHELKEAAAERQSEPVKLVALVAGLRKLPTKNHDMMCIAQLEDHYGTIDAVLFPRTWNQYEALMTEGSVVLVRGKLDVSRGDAQIICESVSQDFEATLTDATTYNPADAAIPSWVEAPDEPAPSAPAPTNGNGHRNGNSHPNGNGHSNGQAATNGHGNRNGNGYVAPPPMPEPPGWDEAPPSWMDESTELLDEPPISDDEAQEVAPCHFTVNFPRTGEADKDRRRLQSIYGILKSFYGKDRFTIHIIEDAYELDFPNDTTLHCDELVAQLEKIVGPGNIIKSV